MAAAIILCAGKGTRMNDDSVNKVCFPAAGVPVIKRIVDNLRAGGVDTFVVVVGHKAQSVMHALKDEEGVIYTYQEEQKGTGHAALCGFSALKSVGYNGKAIVTMGDKIVSSDVIRGLLEKSRSAKAVWGVQPISENYHGGRVVVRDESIFGVVEFADAALMAIADLPEEKRKHKLKDLRLNEKKAEKVLAKAAANRVLPYVEMGGKRFFADEILSAPYANAGLYCFDVHAAIDAIGRCNTANAQGEIYLTDTLAIFAKNGEAALYLVEHKKDMLTFSTKTELREISEYFYSPASVLKKRFDCKEEEKERYQDLFDRFIRTFGDKKTVVTQSPGRVNFMGRHIDHRGGTTNVMAIDKNVTLLVSPREDDLVNVICSNGLYPDTSFSISACLSLSKADDWLSYIESENVKAAVSSSAGQAVNYIKASVLRLQFTTNVPLCGMDILIDGTIPIAAGLSSSSAIVVAAAEAVCFLNNLRIEEKNFVELCGEAEWYVGSRGGANDQGAMKCCKAGQITQLSFKPFTIGKSIPFFENCAIIVANSMQMAKKSEGSKDRFNAKVTCYEIALMLLQKHYPHLSLCEFRDIADIENAALIYELVKFLPRTLTRQQVLDALPERESELKRLFRNHADPDEYDIRGVALFGISECVRAKKCLDALREKDFCFVGEMMKISHRGDSVTDPASVDDYSINRLADNETPLHLVSGAYGCSTEQIDELCNLLNGCEGVFGSELAGAGLGGSVVALVKKDNVEAVMKKICSDYYDKYGYQHDAYIFHPSDGSKVIF